MPLQVVDQISKKRKRHAYDASFKIRVATYAIENGNNSKAARKFDVSEKQVRDWKKTCHLSMNCHAARKLVVGGPHSI